MKSVVVISGGMDSTIALVQTVHKHGKENVEAISFYYGQKQKVELDKAKRTCEMQGVKHTIIDISFMREYLANKSANIDGSSIETPTADEVVNNSQPVTYVPNRNMMLASIGASYAESVGASEIVMGFQSQDTYGYWDCTPEFVDAMNTTLALNRQNKITLVTPLVGISKVDELKQFVELVGMEEALAVLANTLTCYDPSGEYSCGICPSCVDRLHAFEANGLSDPIKYVKLVNLGNGIILGWKGLDDINLKTIEIDSIGVLAEGNNEDT